MTAQLLFAPSRGTSRLPDYYGALKEMRSTAVSQSWVLLRYAQYLLRDLKRNGLRPDPHWHDQRADFTAPPPRPAPTAGASSKGRAATGGAGGLGGMMRKVAVLIFCPQHNVCCPLYFGHRLKKPKNYDY